MQLQHQGSPYEDDFTFPRVRFVRLPPGAERRTYPVGKSERLRHLYYRLNAIARDLRVNDWEAAGFVLLGVPPAVPRYSIVYQDRIVSDHQIPIGVARQEWFPVAWIELEIHDRFFSPEDLRRVFSELRRTGYLLSKKSPAQLDKLRRLAQFVNERRGNRYMRGTGLLGGAMPWKRVLREWNETNSQERYCLSGIQKAYKEACDYLEGRPVAASRRRGRRSPAAHRSDA